MGVACRVVSPERPTVRDAGFSKQVMDEESQYVLQVGDPSLLGQLLLLLLLLLAPFAYYWVAVPC
jgi:hypothetical protein